MIFVGSRYEFAPVDRVMDRRGEYQAAVYKPRGPVLTGFTFYRYLVNEGDRLDALAAHFLGDSEKWWLICEANPELFDFDPLVPGTVIRMPHAR